MNPNAGRGVSDTGDFSNDLTEILLALGKVAQQKQRGVLLFIDEIQYMKDGELEFMTAMVKCGSLPCTTKEIAKAMGEESLQRISPLRAQLIHKGFIYAANRGSVDFTVPQFNKYLKRTYGIE